MDEIKKEPKQKTRVSYPKEIRSEANFMMKGMVTISVTFPDGTRLEQQQSADVDECQFAKWAAVLLGRPDVRPLPLLEDVVREVCEQKGITE